MGDSAPVTPPWRKPRPSPRWQSVASSSAAEEAGPVAESTVSNSDTEPPSPCDEACVGAVAPSAAPEVGPEEDEGENASSGSLEPQRFLPRWKTRQSSLMKAQSKQRPKPQEMGEFPREVAARSADDRKRLREGWRPSNVEGAEVPREHGSLGQLRWSVQGAVRLVQVEAARRVHWEGASVLAPDVQGRLLGAEGLGGRCHGAVGREGVVRRLSDSCGPTHGSLPSR